MRVWEWFMGSRGKTTLPVALIGLAPVSILGVLFLLSFGCAPALGMVWESSSLDEWRELLFVPVKGHSEHFIITAYGLVENDYIVQPLNGDARERNLTVYNNRSKQGKSLLKIYKLLQTKNGPEPKVLIPFKIGKVYVKSKDTDGVETYDGILYNKPAGRRSDCYLKKTLDSTIDKEYILDGVMHIIYNIIFTMYELHRKGIMGVKLSMENFIVDTSKAGFLRDIRFLPRPWMLLGSLTKLHY